MAASLTTEQALEHIFSNDWCDDSGNDDDEYDEDNEDDQDEDDDEEHQEQEEVSEEEDVDEYNREHNALLSEGERGRDRYGERDGDGDNDSHLERQQNHVVLGGSLPCPRHSLHVSHVCQT